MIHGRNKELLGLLFLGAGVVTGALLFYWIWEGQRAAHRPTSTDWPEWRQKEWKKQQKKTGPPKYPQPTNCDAVRDVCETLTER